MPERYKNSPERSKDVHPERAERQKAIQELLDEHKRVNDEWNILVAEDSRLLSEAGDDIKKLAEIHERRVSIVDRLWKIEQKIIELSTGDR